MKSIDLTEEQKDKLLEMTKQLFPEYNEIELEIEPRYDGSNGFVMLTKDSKDIMNFISIHWFEFCIKHVVDELAWRNTTTDMLADCEFEDYRMNAIKELFKDRISPEVYHPVDYLYGEFKKLNNEQKTN